MSNYALGCGKPQPRSGLKSPQDFSKAPRTPLKGEAIGACNEPLRPRSSSRRPHLASRSEARAAVAPALLLFLHDRFAGSCRSIFLPRSGLQRPTGPLPRRPSHLPHVSSQRKSCFHSDFPMNHYAFGRRRGVRISHPGLKARAAVAPALLLFLHDRFAGSCRSIILAAFGVEKSTGLFQSAPNALPEGAVCRTVAAD